MSVGDADALSRPLRSVLSLGITIVRTYLSLVGLALLAAVAMFIAHDVTLPRESPVSSWITFFAFSIAFGATAGWCCQSVLSLISLTLGMSYVLPYAFYYLPALLSGPPGSFESRKWAPLVLPTLILYCAPVVSLSAGIAFAIHARLSKSKQMPNQQVQPTADGAVSSASRSAPRVGGG